MDKKWREMIKEKTDRERKREKMKVRFTTACRLGGAKRLIHDCIDIAILLFYLVV